MGYHDGKSFFSLDFSLHGEKCKNKNRPYGLSASQIKNRYSKKRGNSDKGNERVNEYFLSKITSSSPRDVSGVIFFGMIKTGKTRYRAFDKDLTSKEIVDLLRRKKMIKRFKLLGC